ncbi:flavodoxin family protein [Thalassotalea agarivorans]|uniref:Multimeric flavodoxin WrbA n=1 Tax=Thalassotalea agarivorans TaxID=349064 RepID=A0A1H9ZDC0_THASX|nr:NAD(P)H-dependent oxidoreductase [Thalassotalea agarivorans]SES79618.1 Multimeric flavodoxin WrbA [Thalassotalea agarivorans]
MKIAIVLGTSRRNGNTANLVEYFIEQYPAQCTLFHLSNYDIAPYDYNFNNQDDDFLPLITNIIENYDAIILASPVYWYAPSAQMKVFMDRLSDLLVINKPLGRKLKGMSAGVIATGVVSKPNTCFEEIFRATFNYLHMPYIGMLYCTYADEIENIASHQQYLDKHVSTYVTTAFA